MNIAIFASGSGTNAEKLILHFRNNKKHQIKLILSNKKDAFVLERANKYNIPSMVFDKQEFYEYNNVMQTLDLYKIDFIILAGFLWLVPEKYIRKFPNRIVNIHPALLPAYGGKGMYGMKVHEAVITNKEKESGITIHFVNEKFDDGLIVFQAKCTIETTDTAETLAQKIHQLEYEHFAKIVEKILEK